MITVVHCNKLLMPPHYTHPFQVPVESAEFLHVFAVDVIGGVLVQFVPNEAISIQLVHHVVCCLKIIQEQKKIFLSRKMIQPLALVSCRRINFIKNTESFVILK